MTEQLEKAISEIKKLPDEDQDAIAAAIMAELESERRWDNAFDRSHDELSRLAGEALQEYRTDRTEPLALTPSTVVFSSDSERGRL